MPVGAQAPPAVTVVEVAASLHVLVLLSDGSVVALGENRSGQLGRPKAIGRFLPAERVPLPAKAVHVAAGEDVSFALLDDGTVWAWGRGYAGTLGEDLKGSTERHTPAAVPGLRNVVQIEADGNTAMAVLADGTVRAWGALPPILTDGREVHPGVFVPRKVSGLENIVSVTGGTGFGFALTRDGRVFGWGSNREGFLGLGRTTPEPQPPTELPTLGDVVSIARSAPPRPPSRATAGSGRGGTTSRRDSATGCTPTRPTPVSRRHSRSRASPTRSR